MAIAMYFFVAPVVIFCGHSAPQKYGVNIRLGRYSFCPYDTQQSLQIICWLQNDQTNKTAVNERNAPSFVINLKFKVNF